MPFTSASLKAAFNAFDLSGDGVISREEFVAILTRPGGGKPTTREEAERMFNSFDMDRNGAIDFNEFVAAWTSVSGMVDVSPQYFALEGLLAPVASGAIGALKGSWVVAQQASGGRVQRRQDLPPEAFWTTEELRRVAEALSDDFGLLFVALSYRWLSKGDPDPDGFHLGIVAAVAKLYLKGKDFGRHCSPLAAAFEKAGLGAPDFALFWDFGSLFQAPRTGEEATLFGEGLRASNVWYGHAQSVCWMQSELPPGFSFPPELAQTYELSGWCFVELAISAVMKLGRRRLDLALRTERAMECAYGGELLATEKKFTAPSDVEVVTCLYRSFFSAVAATAVELGFSRLSWGDAEAVQFSAALQLFAVLKTLDLSWNQIGSVGATALAKALHVSPSLTTLILRSNKFGPEGGKAIGEALAVNTSLTSLNLARNNLKAEGAAALAPAIAVSPSLTSLDVRYNDIKGEGASSLSSAVLNNLKIEMFNLIPIKEMRADSLTELNLYNKNIGVEGGMVVARLLPVMTSLTSLDVSSNYFGPEGAKVFAKAIAVSPSLTSLDVGGNEFGPEGAKVFAKALEVNTSLTSLNVRMKCLDNDSKQLLRDAVADRSGFDLKL